MDTGTSVVIIGIAYKIASLAVGLAFAVMGYRLFLADKGKPAGDLDVVLGKHKLKLTRATPGVFFAVLGAAIVLITIWKGIEFDQTPSSIHKPNTSILPRMIPPSDAPSGEAKSK